MIVGFKNLELLAANIQAANRGVLPDEVYAEAKRCMGAAGITAG